MLSLLSTARTNLRFLGDLDGKQQGDIRKCLRMIEEAGKNAAEQAAVLPICRGKAYRGYS